MSLRLLRHSDFPPLGITPRRLASALQMGALVRIRPGVFASGDEWSSAKPEARIIARARALAAVSPVSPVFSHETAAAIHGLPLFRPDRERVHIVAPVARPGGARGVIRHRGDISPADVVQTRDGLVCTTLERTVADVARTASFEQAVTIADAALRQRCIRGPGGYREDEAAAFRQEAIEITKRSAHGQTRALCVLEFADGRSQLPGESISRIRLHELGFHDVRLQVEVPGPGGRRYFVDFGLEEVGAFGEFDGAIKYVDGKFVDGRTASQVLDEEKQREDWIRGTTQRRYARWGWPHVATASALGDRLRAFGIRSP